MNQDYSSRRNLWINVDHFIRNRNLTTITVRIQRRFWKSRFIFSIADNIFVLCIYVEKEQSIVTNWITINSISIINLSVSLLYVNLGLVCLHAELVSSPNLYVFRVMALHVTSISDDFPIHRSNASNVRSHVVSQMIKTFKICVMFVRMHTMSMDPNHMRLIGSAQQIQNIKLPVDRQTNESRSIRFVTIVIRREGLNRNCVDVRTGKLTETQLNDASMHCNRYKWLHNQDEWSIPNIWIGMKWSGAPELPTKHPKLITCSL